MSSVSDTFLAVAFPCKGSCHRCFRNDVKDSAEPVASLNLNAWPSAFSSLRMSNWNSDINYLWSHYTNNMKCWLIIHHSPRVTLNLRGQKRKLQGFWSVSTRSVRTSICLPAGCDFPVQLPPPFTQDLEGKFTFLNIKVFKTVVSSVVDVKLLTCL